MNLLRQLTFNGGTARGFADEGIYTLIGDLWTITDELDFLIFQVRNINYA